MQQPKKQRKRRYAVPIGGVFVVLAVIGVITVIIAAVWFSISMLDNQREKEQFSDKILPVVMFDPAPFESPSDIPMSQLLLSSMWATLSSDRATTYTYSEDTAALMVPASDLEVAARSLFGDGVSLEHETFTDFATTYVYDEESNMYNFPVADSQLYVFTPEIKEITKNGEYYNLLVYYQSPPDAWTTIFKGATGGYEKHMIYVMKQTDNGWNIVKIVDPLEEGATIDIPGVVPLPPPGETGSSMESSDASEAGEDTSLEDNTEVTPLDTATPAATDASESTQDEENSESSTEDGDESEADDTESSDMPEDESSTGEDAEGSSEDEE